MSEDNSWLLQTIVAKSDQLNAVDLVAGPITVKIERVKELADKTQPVAIYYEGCNERPFKPCLSMRRVLLACWGIDNWYGRLMTLFADPKVKWGGEDVGGVRISHLSNLGVPKREIQLNESKHKKITWTVYNIEVAVSEERLTKAVKAIESCKSQEQLEKAWKLCQPLYAACDDTQKDVLSSAKTEQDEVVKNG